MHNSKEYLDLHDSSVDTYSPRHSSKERDHNEQLISLRNQYDSRIKSLSSNIQLFLQDLCADDIFNAMRENPLSQDYALQRIEEMFENSMNTEKEETIIRLTQEFTEKEGYMARLESENQ